MVNHVRGQEDTPPLIHHEAHSSTGLSTGDGHDATDRGLHAICLSWHDATNYATSGVDSINSRSKDGPCALGEFDRDHERGNALKCSEVDEAEQEVARRRKGKAIVKPSKTRDSAFKRLGDKEDGPRKSAKLRLGPEMGRTSAMGGLGGSRPAPSRRSRESETIHLDEEEVESHPRASAYTRLSYDEDDLDKIGSVARKLRALEEKVKLDVEKFTRKEDPNVHLDTFHNAAHMAGCTDAEECLLFFSSLRGRPVEWFNGLPHGRIWSFEKFVEVFRKKYQDNCIKRKKFTYLNTSGDLYTEFCRRPSSSYQEAYNTAWEYVEAEVLNKSKQELEEGHTKVKSDKPKKDDQTGGSKPKATYDGSIHQIRDEKKGEQHKRP
ncbi:unnamed protein product [Cuscuta campestris]|uniref:Retrotransposon gag domain-containing protein n=1 Tax=Cuscuta campestris TaxID=132261 RepID=A0A484L407_9ASTE|nr:unnamed protein product [Cuscuta campestris]